MGNLLNKLLIMLNDNDLYSTNYHISKKLLLNFYLLQNMSINDVAKLCNVSKSKISKFIRLLDFENYNEFRAAAFFKENRYGFDLNYNQNIAEFIEKNGYKKYLDIIRDDILLVENLLNNFNIDELVNDLINFEKIAAFGLLFSEIGALDLQMKLAYNGKFIFTNLDDIKQDVFIKNSDEKTLIIIYSNSGEYLKKYQLSEFLDNKDYSKVKSKIVLITGNREMLNYKFIDNCILYEKKSNVQTHSIIFPLINDIIINRYRIKISKVN